MHLQRQNSVFRHLSDADAIWYSFRAKLTNEFAIAMCRNTYGMSSTDSKFNPGENLANTSYFVFCHDDPTLPFISFDGSVPCPKS